MALWPRKRKARMLALIDIGSASVAGAYAELIEGVQPTIHYAARLTIEHHTEEATEAAMLRTLGNLCDLLVKEGAPTLRREAGRGSVDSVLVSIAAPWQETVVRTESLQQPKAFIFTKQLMHELASRSAATDSERVSSGASVIATLLNGYDVTNPFGKRATRAEVVVLSSTLHNGIVAGVTEALRRAFHAHEISFVSFASVMYAVFRDRYPLEKEYLILDVSGEGSDLVFVKNGILTNVASIPKGARNVNDWSAALVSALGECAMRAALPRTLFVLTDDERREQILKALDTPALHALWLSDEPLRLVPILPGQFASSVQAGEAALPDIFLAVLALYAAKRVEPLAPVAPSAAHLPPPDPIIGM